MRPTTKRPTAPAHAIRASSNTQKGSEKPYDGILGTPPQWVPEFFQLVFHQNAAALLTGGKSRPTPAKVRKWMLAYPERLNLDTLRGVTPIPSHVLPHVEMLYWIWHAVELEKTSGEAEAIRFLLGPNLSEMLAKERAKREKAAESGKLSGNARRVSAERARNQAHKEATRLLGSGKKPHNIVSILDGAILDSQGKAYHAKTIRHFLRDHPSGHWATKK